MSHHRSRASNDHAETSVFELARAGPGRGAELGSKGDPSPNFLSLPLQKSPRNLYIHWLKSLQSPYINKP